VWVHGVFDVDFEPFKEFVFLDFYFDNMIGSIVVWSGCFSRLEVIWDFHDFGLQPFCPDGLAFAQISSGL
jgi:hypothetical protein